MRTKLKRLHQPEIPNSLNNDKKTAYAMNRFDIDEIFDNNEVLEIYVPTCSYRMGEMDIGFGYAILGESSLAFFYCHDIHRMLLFW